MPTIIDGSGSATFQTPLPLAQGGSGNTTGNVVSSQVAGAFNATGSAPLFACRAWVNFNGTGTVAIRASGNVSSITDNGVGDYTVNFATAMPDVNYSVGGSASANNDANVLAVDCIKPFSYSTSFIRIQVTYGAATLAAGGAVDRALVNVAIFR